MDFTHLARFSQETINVSGTYAGANNSAVAFYNSGTVTAYLWRIFPINPSDLVVIDPENLPVFFDTNTAIEINFANVPGIRALTMINLIKKCQDL